MVSVSGPGLHVLVNSHVGTDRPAVESAAAAKAQKLLSETIHDSEFVTFLSSQILNIMKNLEPMEKDFKPLISSQLPSTKAEQIS